MKLNNFFSKTPKSNLRGPKIITVTNEAREKELLAQIADLQVYVERLGIVDKDNLDLRTKLTDVEGFLNNAIKKEQELTNTNGRLQLSVNEGDTFRSDNQWLRNEHTVLTLQLGVKESIIEQAQKTNLELNLTTEKITNQLKELQVENVSLQDKLEASLQQTATSLVHLKQMQMNFENTHKIFKEIEVKYKESQRKNSDLTKEVTYWTSVAKTLQEERDELEQTRYMLKELATTMKTDNVEKSGAVRVTQTELKKVRGVMGTMTTNMDNLIQENHRLSDFNSALKAELARPKYMSMSAIQHSEGFKLPSGGYRKHFLGNSKPTLLKFKVKEGGNDN